MWCIYILLLLHDYRDSKHSTRVIRGTSLWQKFLRYNSFLKINTGFNSCPLGGLASSHLQAPNLKIQHIQVYDLCKLRASTRYEFIQVYKRSLQNTNVSAVLNDFPFTFGAAWKEEKRQQEHPPHLSSGKQKNKKTEKTNFFLNTWSNIIRELSSSNGNENVTWK